jgi:hypothetical protein
VLKWIDEVKLFISLIVMGIGFPMCIVLSFALAMTNTGICRLLFSCI